MDQGYIRANKPHSSQYSYCLSLFDINSISPPDKKYLEITGDIYCLYYCPYDRNVWLAIVYFSLLTFSKYPFVCQGILSYRGPLASYCRDSDQYIRTCLDCNWLGADT